MKTLKQSTAYDFMVFMTDSTDHVTGKTGLTLTITASKAGAAFASITPTVTERGSGWYSLALTTSHTDTVGDFALHVTSSGADPSDCVAQVRANVLGDTLPASVAGAVGSVTGAVGSVTGNVGGNVNGNVVGSTGSVTGNVGGNVTGSVGSVAGNVSGSVGSVAGAVGSVTGAVGSVVGNVGGNVVGSTASVAGAVGSVTGGVGGDVSGKVLGGGAGTITGDGVRAASVTGAVGSVTGSVGSVVGDTPQTGDSYPIISSGTHGNAALKTIVDTKASQASVDGVPTNAEFAAGIAPLATEANVDDTKAYAAAGAGSASSAATNTTDLPSMIEDVGGPRFTEAALAEGPSGGGGGDCPSASEIAAATAALLGDNPVQYQTAVTEEGHLDLVRGMDYYTADGRDIEFTFIREYVPTSCKLTIAAGGVVTVTSTDIAESSGSGSGRFHVRFQLPRADGDDLESGPGTFEVYSIVSGREVAEISEGVATIRRRLTPTA